MLVQVGLAGLAAVALPTLLVRQHVRALLYFGEDGERTPAPEDLTGPQKLAVLVRGAVIPKPRNVRTPRDLGFDYSTSVIDVPDGHRLEVWTVKGSRGQVLLFHGYTQPKDQVLDALPWFHARGYTVHLVDFRASGGSSGHRTTLGAEEAHDVAAAVRWAAARGEPNPLVVYGFSMGGAAILGALADGDLPVDAAIVAGVYAGLASPLANRFRTRGLPASPGRELLMLWGSVELRRNAWRVAPVEDAARVRAPVLVLVGEDDPRVGVADGRAIAEALPDGRLVVLEGGGHDPGFLTAPEPFTLAVEAFLSAR
ncbi:MAG: alpha/beta fold hydrolase [Myxococcales bacterium]|nr:alpha/beta fold hydrolase [Myxococcales bacterium]